MRKITIKEEPWRHAIIENFFDRETFKFIDDYSINLTNSIDWDKQLSQTLKGIPKSNRFKASTNGMPDTVFNTIKEIYEEYYHILNTSKDFYFDITKADVSIEFQMRAANESKISEKKGNIHTDSILKIMSFVICLSDKGSGTTLHNNDNTVHSVTEWKKNSALVFVRNEEEGKQTYHSILNEEDEVRRVLVSFIINPK